MSLPKRPRAFVFATVWLFLLYIGVRAIATIFVARGVSADLYVALVAPILFLPFLVGLVFRKLLCSAMFVVLVTTALPVVLAALPSTIAESLAYSIDNVPPANTAPSRD